MDRYFYTSSSRKRFNTTTLSYGNGTILFDKTIKTPIIRDDYYLNILDTCGDEIIAGFDRRVFIIKNKTAFNYYDLKHSGYVSAVKYVENKIYIGTQQGYLLKFDKETKILEDCTKFSHGRIPTLDISNGGVIIGFGNGNILHHDFRQSIKKSEVLISNKEKNYGEIISYAKNDFNIFAFGTSENDVNIYDSRSTRELKRLREHKGAVKALKFCPWKQSKLYTGGGYLDNRIICWDIFSFKKIAERDSGSQVCNIHFLPEKTMVTTHGYYTNSIIEWKPQRLEKIGENIIHRQRVLFSAYNKENNILITASPDQSLKIWNISRKDKEEVRNKIKEVSIR